MSAAAAAKTVAKTVCGPLKQPVTKSSWLPAFVKSTSVGVPQEHFTIDCARYQGKLGKSEELKWRVSETFKRVGLVYLTNTGTVDTEQLQKPFTHLIGGGLVYEGGANPRSPVEGNVYDTGVSMESFVHYHHEMAYLEKSVKTLSFFCKKLSPGVKGGTYVSDNVGVTNALAHTTLGRKLREKGVCYIRKLTDRNEYINKAPVGVYNHWQKSFLTESPAEAERKAQNKGLQVEWEPKRHMITKYYSPSYEYCPHIDRNLLYASLADHSIWFDTWPNVKDLPQEERPLKMTYGDDSEFTDDEVSEFVEVYDRFGMELPWTEGDAALVCNYRFLHGRPVIHLQPGQSRDLGVILGEEFTRQGAMPGKW